MALDTIAGIREYRAQVADAAISDPRILIGILPGTLLTMLDTLLGVIEEQDKVLTEAPDLE